MASPLVVLVTGAGGQLGQELLHLAHGPKVRIVGLSRHALDVTDPGACRRSVASVRPDVVIHAAAYTEVDRAESEPEAARRVNVDGARYMAEAAEAAGAGFCYVSTDYVFDGNGTRPYVEEDPTNPQTVYGQTKRAGELAVLAASSRAYVVRTSWLYGAYGKNFVRTMLQLARAGKPLRVVDDQVGSPTWVYELAELLLQLVQTERYGIYHAVGGGSCSWYHFARSIFEICGMKAELAPCTTDEFPRPAPRPAYSALDCAKLKREGLSPMRHWRQSLTAFLQAQGEAHTLFPNSQ